MNTKQLHILLLIWLCSWAACAEAQTPYDSFAPEMSRPILDKDSVDAWRKEQQMLREQEQTQRQQEILARLQQEPLLVAFDMPQQMCYLLDTAMQVLAYSPIPEDVQRWLSVDPLVDKNISTSPYLYCNGNPVMFVDPDGRDEEQREAAIRKAEEYVIKNPGNSYKIGGKGEPGSSVDCSGMVSRCIIAGGEQDPVLKGKGNGVKRIADASIKIDNIQDIEPGFLLTFDTGMATGIYSHIGIVSNIEVDDDGNIIQIYFIHAGSNGPTKSSLSNSYWKTKMTGIYKWDTRPDQGYQVPLLPDISVTSQNPFHEMFPTTINITCPTIEIPKIR